MFYSKIHHYLFALFIIRKKSSTKSIFLEKERKKFKTGKYNISKRKALFYVFFSFLNTENGIFAKIKPH